MHTPVTLIKFRFLSWLYMYNITDASCGAVVMKLTDTGCMEDDTDEIYQQYQQM